MNIGEFLNSPFFTWVVLPCLIFLARICDVTIGTIRIIVVSKGNKALASLLGFFEVLIWLIAIGQIMKHLDNAFCYIAYAAGFAMGNFIGITVEGKLAMGTLEVRIHTNHNGDTLAKALTTAGFGVTTIYARGSTGPVSLISTVIKRGALPEVNRIIRNFNPNTFYSVEEARYVNAGIFPNRLPSFRLSHFNLLRHRNHRKEA